MVRKDFCKSFDCDLLVCEEVETTGGGESAGGEGVSRWRSLVEVRV